MSLNYYQPSELKTQRVDQTENGESYNEQRCNEP